MFVGVAAISFLIPFIGVVRFPTVNTERSSSQSNLRAACKTNVLKYEQIWYYADGAAQFNALMTTCTVGGSVG